MKITKNNITEEENIKDGNEFDNIESDKENEEYTEIEDSEDYDDEFPEVGENDKIQWRLMLGIEGDMHYMGEEDEEIDRQLFIMKYFFQNHNCYEESRGVFVTNAKMTKSECIDLFKKFVTEYPQVAQNISKKSTLCQYTPSYDMTYLFHLPKDVQKEEFENIRKLQEEGVSDEEIYSKERTKQFNKYLPKWLKHYKREQERELRRWKKDECDENGENK